MCVFARQDVTRDPPFSKLDLVVCRNLLIYLGAGLQKKLMGMFHYALRPSGFLMLGSAETVGIHADLFSIADKKHRIYRKKGDREWPRRLLPVDYVSRRETAGACRRPSRRRKPPYNGGQPGHPRALQPPAVIVDSDLQIIQFRGQTGTYLEPAPGEASLNLLKMAREGLLHGLRTALAEAGKTDKPARRDGLKVKADGKLRHVAMEVIPLPKGSSGPTTWSCSKSRDRPSR